MKMWYYEFMNHFLAVWMWFFSENGFHCGNYGRLSANCIKRNYIFSTYFVIFLKEWLTIEVLYSKIVKVVKDVYLYLYQGNRYKYYKWSAVLIVWTILQAFGYKEKSNHFKRKKGLDASWRRNVLLSVWKCEYLWPWSYLSFLFR